MAKTTHKAMFRGHKPEQAIRKTRKTISVSDHPLERGFRTPDQKFATRVGIPIEARRIPPTADRAERVVKQLVIRPQDLPPNDMKRSKLFGAVRDEFYGSGAHHRDPNLPSDPAIATTLKTGRTVFVHSFLARVLANMVLLTVQKLAELSMCVHSHAYRLNRSRFSALDDVSHLVRKYPFFIPLDIQSYFASVSPALARDAIAKSLPWIGGGLLRTIDWLLRPPVIFRPGHPRWRAEGSDERYFLKGLAEGGPLAPFSANVVGDVVLGRPFEAVMDGRAILVRFSDDMALMGTTELNAEVGAELAELLLEQHDLHLHPRPRAIDLRRTPTEWLGKRLHGRAVQTPERDIARFIESLARVNPSTYEFKHQTRQLLTELQLDGERRVEFVGRRLREVSQVQWRAFQALRAARLPPLVTPDLNELATLEACDEVAS